MKIPEYCKSCNYFQIVSRCRHIRLGTSENCPCKECLIKAMCKQYCPDFGTFADMVDRNERKM